MKKILLVFVLPFVVLSFVVAKAEALDYNTAYMVTDNNSLTLSVDGSGDYSYTTNQTPWVYLKLKLSELNLTAPLNVLWSWSSFSNTSINETKLEHISLAGLSTDKEVWSAAPEPWWSANGGTGKWTVDVAWLNAHGAYGTSTANFNVTPEPLSSALLLFGGVPLAAALLRKKKTV
ncbi:MAG: PEP-CTERM sorting domain-containing protein [Candidatus Omnitrophica bacterium]|nr:PEP-CTERM sorting domain-containing protein [Candidatus Omnitrophota bacterium]